MAEKVQKSENYYLGFVPRERLQLQNLRQCRKLLTLIRSRLILNKTEFNSNRSVGMNLKCKISFTRNIPVPFLSNLLAKFNTCGKVTCERIFKGSFIFERKRRQHCYYQTGSQRIQFKVYIEHQKIQGKKSISDSLSLSANGS